MAGGYVLLDDETPKYKLIDDGKKGSGSTTLDTANAVGTGFWNGVTSLAGLPVDTVANVLDLGKAAVGAPYIAFTGKAPPKWLEPTDRSEVFGSGANINKAVRKVAPVMVEPINPDYTGGYAQMAGAGLTGVVNPTSKLQATNQAVNGVLGTWLSKAVYDATGNDALAITAGLSPTAVQDVTVRSLKRAVRGGEAGRKEMEQRIQDLKAAGIDTPTLGLASGNTFIGGLENILQNTPGAVKIMQNARDKIVGGLENTVLGAANTASQNRGPLAAGTSIQQGAKTFQQDTKARTEALYNRLGQFIPDQYPVDVTNTRGVLASLNQDIPTMPELSKQFKNGRIQAIESALNSDMAGTPAVPAKTSFTTQRVLSGTDAAGMPVFKDILVPNVTPAVPAGPDRTAIPFEAAKKTRTLVGGEISDNSLVSDVPRSKWKPLYGALSSDIEGAANNAGPQATQAFNRANDYTRNSIARLEKIAPIVDRPTPENTFKATESTLKDNVSLFQALKKSLPEGARGDIAGTVIERLGTAKPGQQDHTGEKFSPETFLTNWNRMDQKGRAELLSGFPNSAQVMADVEAAAKAASMMRDNSKIWANPSGTAARGAAMGYLGTLGAGAGSLLLPNHPIDPTLLLAGMSLPVAANLGARAVTSPRVVKSMASRTHIDPHIINAQVNSLISGGLLNYPQD